MIISKRSEEHFKIISHISSAYLKKVNKRYNYNNRFSTFMHIDSEEKVKRLSLNNNSRKK